MDWSNEMVLEFLQVFGTESVIWDPKHPEHKKKQTLADAWRRINNTLNWQCSIDDLKKKKDSLMAYYRFHLNKIRKMKSARTGIEDDHKTSWFAFDTMNSFLGNIYDCAVSFAAEDISTERIQLLPESMDSTNGSEYLSDLEYQPKKKRREVQKVIVEQTNCVGDKETKECEMYGQLLVHKLMKLEEDDRLILMNKIDNLVFHTTMEANAKRKSPSGTTNLNISSSNKHDNVEKSHCHSPFYEIRSPTYQRQYPAESGTDYNHLQSFSSNVPIIKNSNSSILNVEIKKEII